MPKSNPLPWPPRCCRRAPSWWSSYSSSESLIAPKANFCSTLLFGAGGIFVPSVASWKRLSIYISSLSLWSLWLE